MKQGWGLRNIGDLCEIGDGNHGGHYPKKSDLRPSGVPFIRGVNLVNGEISSEDLRYISKEKHKSLNKGHLKTGDVLFTNRGDIGKCAIVSSEFDDANLNSQIAFFRCSSDLYNRYLFYFLQSPILQSHLLVSKTGAALQQFTIGQIVKLQVPIPPVPEQQRIVALLDETFAALNTVHANAERNRVNAGEVFESVLDSVFTNVGSDWDEKRLDELYDVRDGTHYSPKFYTTGYPFVTSKNLKNGALSFDNIQYISEKDYNDYNKRSKVDKGDILFAMIGTLGNPVVVEVEPDFAIKNVALIKVPSNQSNYFLRYYLESKSVREKFYKNANGTTQKFVGLGNLRKFKILIPPLAKQRSIVAELDALSIETRRLEHVYQCKVDAVKVLRKSVLQKAFEGSL